jgi:TPR repeat protein
MRQLALAAVLVLGLAAPAGADFEDGKAAYERGDYARAYQEFLPLAAQGHTEAQAALCHSPPWGREPDVNWCRFVAEQGYAEAQYTLGMAFYIGWGAPRNSEEAAKWLLPLAQKGHGAAQFALGEMYYEGWGVPQSYIQAYMWVKLAAVRLPPGVERDLAVEGVDIIANKISPSQVAEAQKAAREWLEKHEKAD